METALINLAVFRSIHHSAAFLALSRKFADLWAARFETKKITLHIESERFTFSLEDPLSVTDEESTDTGRIIKAATLWEAALEVGSLKRN